MFLIKYSASLNPAQCKLFYVPDIVSRPLDPGTIYDILCSWFSFLPLQPWQYVCCSMFLKKYPAPSAPAQCMLFYGLDLISCFLTAAQCMLFYVLDIVCCPCDPDTIYVVLCPRFFSRPCSPGTTYVILCSWFSFPPLQHRHNVCYFMFLI